jgi:serine/threonine protein kinase
MIAIGERIGDYVVERELGEDVYEAVHVLLPRRARVRVIAALASPPMRESCVLEALRHPSVPRVFECGTLPDRRPWIASELVEGVATGDILLAVDEVVAMLRDVADVLAHAHARGIVHGQLTSDAIVFRTEPARSSPGIVVIGWGFARSGVHGGRDVLALGEIALEALFGSVDAPRRWAGVPMHVAALIERMLDRDPARRPTAAAVRDEAARIATLDLDADVGVVEVELIDVDDRVECLWPSEPRVD